MSIIGNPIVYQANPYYEATGDNVTTSFTLSWAPGSLNAIIVTVGGVAQSNSNYSLAGNVITFATAPATGALVIVRGLGIRGVSALDNTNAVTQTSQTGAAQLPVGGTLARPATPNNGYIRYNSDNNQFEGGVNGSWQPVGQGATGTNGEQVYMLTQQTSNYSYTIPAGYNAIMNGNTTWGTGGGVTIPTGSSLTVVGGSESDLLHKSGAETVTGLKTFSTAPNFQADATFTTKPMFSAYQSVAQAIPSNVMTKVQFQTKDFDSTNAFDNVTNFRFQPTKAGYYQVNMCVDGSNVHADGGIYLYKNGTSYKASTYIYGGAARLAGSEIVYLNGTSDYIECWIIYSAAVTLSTPSTYFQAYYISNGA